jgi:hypothetical protein
MEGGYFALNLGVNMWPHFNILVKFIGGLEKVFAYARGSYPPRGLRKYKK